MSDNNNIEKKRCSVDTTATVSSDLHTPSAASEQQQQQQDVNGESSSAITMGTPTGIVVKNEKTKLPTSSSTPTTSGTDNDDEAPDIMMEMTKNMRNFTKERRRSQVALTAVVTRNNDDDGAEKSNAKQNNNNEETGTDSGDDHFLTTDLSASKRSTTHRDDGGDIPNSSHHQLASSGILAHSNRSLNHSASMINNGVGNSSGSLSSSSQQKNIWDGQDIIVLSPDSWVYAPNRPTWLNSILLVVLVLVGFFEGWLFARCGIISPLAIAGQFSFSVWIVMKLYFGALGASFFFQAILELLCPSLYAETRIPRYTKSGYIRSFISGGLIGFGALLSGSGATMTPASMAADVGNSYFCFIGYLIGGVSVYLFEKNFFKREKVNLKKDKMTLDEMFGLRYWKLALPVGLFCYACGCVLEFAIPGTSMKNDEARLSMGPLSVPAVATGAWIGFGQIAYRLIAHVGQGGSSAIFNIISFFTWGKVAPDSFPDRFARIWQLCFVYVGTTLGALLSVRVGYDGFIAPSGFNIARNIVGGIFTIWGSKLGSGCICGASISSVGDFGVEQIAQTAGMFAVGIPCAFIFQAAGVPTTPDQY